MREIKQHNPMFYLSTDFFLGCTRDDSQARQGAHEEVQTEPRRVCPDGHAPGILQAPQRGRQVIRAIHRTVSIPIATARRRSNAVLALSPLTAKLFNLNFHPLEVVSR